MPDYLLDAIPVDPFDGKALRYKKNLDGALTIYSVGPDTVGDGGQVESPGKGKRPADVGVVLKLPLGGH